MAKVSIVIPVYNVEKYLTQCMDSVVNQTLKDIEIICIDDGSTDNSGIILDKYADNDNRIKVIHKENGGYGKAMNTGIDYAAGEYIGIVEPDDYIELNMYEILYNKAAEFDVDFIKSDFYTFYPNGDSIYTSLDRSSNNYNRVINLQLDKSPFLFNPGMWTGIYKTDFLKNNNIKYNETPGARYQDQGFWWQTTVLAQNVYFLNIPFYHYRDYAANSTNNPNGFDWIITEFNYIEDFLNRYPERKKYLLAIFYSFKFQHLLFNFNKLSYRNKDKKFAEFLHEFNRNNMAENVDINLLGENEKEQFMLISKNPQKFKKRYAKSLLQKIFSVTNVNNHKQITILGIKLKFKIYKNKSQTITDRIKHLLINLFPNKNFRDRVWRKHVIVPAEIKRQKQVAVYLQKKYVEPYLNNNLPHWKILPKKELKTDKIIWQYWAQGINQNTPEIVTKCIESVSKYKGDYEHIILNNETIGEYIDIPDFVIDKLKNNNTFTYTFFSDLLRVMLLSVYGGIWIDSTILLTNKLETNIVNKDFFVYQRTIEKPKDYKIWENYSCYYFNWEKEFKVNFLSSFIVAKRHNKLITALQDILLEYWKQEDSLLHYFVMHIIFDELIKSEQFKNENCEIMSDCLPHLLQIKLNKKFDQTYWNKSIQETSIHKLSYKIHKDKHKYKTFYDYIMQT